MPLDPSIQEDDMTKKEYLFTFACAGIIFIVCIIVAVRLGDLLMQPHIPQCHEDAVIVGIGDFEDGKWSEYVCGPSLDDFNYDWNGLQ